MHLPRLPSINYKPEVDLDELIEQAVYESKVLDDLGYTGVIVENYGDYPYSKRVVDPLILSSMSIITREVVRNPGFKVGVNLLRNSGREAYAIAVTTKARFIRVNTLVDTILSDS
ncbi:MAG: BtpA/SgcQ family protein, partial [Desulfurococcaceae archaeon]